MAIVLKEVQELERMKDQLRKDAIEIFQNPDYTQNEKQSYIGKITDEIYDIDQEIIRLKKQPSTIQVIKTDNSVLFLIIGIGVIFLLNRKK